MLRSAPLCVVVNTNVVFEGLTCRGTAAGLIVETISAQHDSEVERQRSIFDAL
jgi:hypothetical protein